jgi:hypothetical protein
MPLISGMDERTPTSPPIKRRFALQNGADVTFGQKAAMKQRSTLLVFLDLESATRDNRARLPGVLPGSLSPFALENDTPGKVRLAIAEELSRESAFLLHPLDKHCDCRLDETRP